MSFLIALRYLILRFVTYFLGIVVVLRALFSPATLTKIMRSTQFIPVPLRSVPVRFSRPILHYGPESMPIADLMLP